MTVNGKFCFDVNNWLAIGFKIDWIASMSFPDRKYALKNMHESSCKSFQTLGSVCNKTLKQIKEIYNVLNYS